MLLAEAGIDLCLVMARDTFWHPRPPPVLLGTVGTPIIVSAQGITGGDGEGRICQGVMGEGRTGGERPGYYKEMQEGDGKGR